MEDMWRLRLNPVSIELATILHKQKLDSLLVALKRQQGAIS